MIIGFGDTETRNARNFVEEVRDAIEGSDEPEKVVRALTKRQKREAKAFDKLPASEAPERYFHPYVNANIIYPGKVLVEFTFLHINRRHALSPDGWACFNDHWVLITNNEPLDTVVYRQEAP